MPTPIDWDRWRLYQGAIEACLRDGFTPVGVHGGRGSACEEAERRLRIEGNWSTNGNGDLTRWVRRQEKRRQRRQEHMLPNWSLYAPPGAAKPAEPARPTMATAETAEARGALQEEGFWKKRAKALGKELSAVEHMLAQVAGIRSMYVQPADWLLTKPSSEGRRKRAVVGLLFTDLHMGEVINADELNGLNEYNPEIAERRAQRFFQAACEIGPRWASDCDLQGAFLALGGDLISADLHEELKMSNALTSVEQVRAAASVIITGIHRLKETFKRVHVASVPGNHGRTTLKPTAKLYARLSYDTLIAQMVADAFKGDANVTFQIGSAPDAIIPILGHTVLLTHGDKLGGGGGTGFIGPMAPIIRGAKKVEAQQARANRRPDLIIHGHFHTSGSPGNVLSNGSFPGYSEYGHALRAAIEPPQQWLFLLHETWGVREKAEIKLEPPAPKPLPRVRVPAAMAERG